MRCHFSGNGTFPGLIQPFGRLSLTERSRNHVNSRKSRRRPDFRNPNMALIPCLLSSFERISLLPENGSISPSGGFPGNQEIPRKTPSEVATTDGRIPRNGRKVHKCHFSRSPQNPASQQSFLTGMDTFRQECHRRPFRKCL